MRYEVPCFHHDVADSCPYQTIDGRTHHGRIDVRRVDGAGDPARRRNSECAVSAAELHDITGRSATSERLQDAIGLKEPLPQLGGRHVAFPTLGHRISREDPSD